jgi:ABC-type nitrate/sulfonate/bicarbonate transport system substrate-binding protein
MLSKKSLRKGVGRVTWIAVAVIIVIIIVGSSYAAISLSKGTTSNSTQTTSTPTSTTSQSSSSTTSSTSSTSTSTSSSSTFAVPPPGQVSSVPFTFCIVNPATNIGVVPNFIVINDSLLQKYDPNAVLDSSPSQSTVEAQALAAGQCQMAIFSQTTLTSDVVRGVVNISEVGVLQGPTIYTVVVGANTSLTSLTQTKTATWSFTSFTILPETILWAQQGWDASSITQVQASSASAAMSSVIAGKAVDLSSIGDSLIPLLAGQVRDLYNWTSPWPTNVIVATPAFIQAHPDAVQAGIDAFLYASSIINNPSYHDAVVNLLLKNFPTYTSAEASALIVPSTNPFPSNGAISLGQLQALINAQYQYKQIPNNATATSMVTNGFCPVIS